MENLAREFATYYHGIINQTRKYTGEPYIVHPAAVAELVRSVPHTEDMICAAWLHDTVEDTSATLNEIEHIFGSNIAVFVGMLTKVGMESGNRATRKQLDRNRLARAHSQVKTIKLADVIHNAPSILAYDPGFAPTFIAESRPLLEVLKEGDATLFQIAKNLVM